MVNLNINNEGGKHIAQYMLQGNDRIDNLTLGMLVNNDIDGIVSVKPVQVGSDRFFKYDIDGMITLEKYLGEYVKKERLLKAFYGIAVTIKFSMEYMINWTSFALDVNSIYVREAEDKTELICVPLLTVINDGNTCNFFKNILFMAQFDPDESEDYVGKLIMSLNPKTYTIEKFIYELEEMLEIEHMQFDINTEEDDEEDNIEDVQNVTEGAQGTSETEQSVAEDTQSTSETEQSVTEDAQSTSETEQSVAEDAQSTSETEQSVAEDAQDTSETEQSVAENAQDTSEAEQSVVKDAQSTVEAEQSVTEDTQDISKTEQNVMEDTRNVSQIGQNIPDSAQNISETIDESTGAIEEIQTNVTTEERVSEKVQDIVNSETDDRQKDEAQKYETEEGQEQVYNEETLEQQSMADGIDTQGEQYEAYHADAVTERAGAYSAYAAENSEEAYAANQATEQAGVYSAYVTEEPREVYTTETEREQQYHYDSGNIQEPEQTGRAYVEGTQAETSSNVEVAETNPYISGYDPYSTVETDNSYAAETDYNKLPFLIRESTKQRYYIDKDKFLIGSDESQVDCFISDNANIDEIHAIIIKRDKEYFIVDNDSKKGTYMNFVDLLPEEESFLPHGARLSLANEEFIFKMHE